ncbi:MAG: TRIC cation channel family protein [Sumerlaeia bacterium]
MLLHLFDLIGTFAFGLAGAFRGVRLGLDLLGVLLLAAVTGTGGGIVRDLVIGERPYAFLSYEPLSICLAAGMMAFLAYRWFAKGWPVIFWADAVGLGVFAATGAAKAIEADFTVFGVIFCGTVTAVGGGVIRDVLTNEVPAIMRTGFYATSAIIASGTMAATREPLIAAAVGTTVRWLSNRYNVQLPKRQQPDLPE